MSTNRRFTEDVISVVCKNSFDDARYLYGLDSLRFY